jgi:signal transduction histidine kinase
MESPNGGPLISTRKTFRRQTRILLWGGFGGLLILMAGLGLRALSFTSQIEVRQEQIRQDYVERDRTLEKLRSDIYISGTYVRDYLLDGSDENAAPHKAAFFETRNRIESGVADYERMVRPGERAVFEQFRKELQGYLDAISPVLGWTAAQRETLGHSFIEKDLLPRRMLSVDLTDRIHELSEQQLDAGSRDVRDLFSSFRTRLGSLLAFTLGTGILLAGLSLWRILALERETEVRFQQLLTAQNESKRLAADLVSAQELERRRISRELHDEVGQVLSAIMLELGNLRSAIELQDIDKSLRQVQLVQDMTQRNANVVRNISLLLRPTMLDDLGLLPALKWLAREISRASGIHVDVATEGPLGDLPEEHRTCVYRVVQEALNNASRHSGARQVRIYVRQTATDCKEERCLMISVQDDGKGFDPSQETGLGILGMEERIVRLGGFLTLDSEPGRGTIVSFKLPLSEDIRGPQPANGARAV